MHSLLVITLVSTPVDDLLKTVSGSKTHQSIKIEEQVVVPDVYIYCTTFTDPDARNETSRQVPRMSHHTLKSEKRHNI